METGPYADFDLCLALREAGFPQKREQGSRYYIRPDMLIKIDDLGVIRSDGDTDFENIFETLVFKPTLGDIEEASRSFFTQVAWTVNAGCFAYSNAPNPDAPEGTDPYIRANGTSEWGARVNLYLSVKNGQNHIVIPPQQLDESENKEQGHEPT